MAHLIRLLFLINEDRMLSQFMHEPRKLYWEATLQNVLRYIKGTLGQWLLLPSENNLRLQAYWDSDWGGFRTSIRFISGSAFSSKIQLFLGSIKSKPMRPDYYRAMTNHNTVWCFQLVTFFELFCNLFQCVSYVHEKLDWLLHVMLLDYHNRIMLIRTIELSNLKEGILTKTKLTLNIRIVCHYDNYMTCVKFFFFFFFLYFSEC